MNSKQRRRRKKLQTDLDPKTIFIVFIFILLIPLLCYWYGIRRAGQVVPEYATGQVVEVTGTDLQ